VSTGYHIVSLCRENAEAVVHYVHCIPLDIIPVGVQIGVQQKPDCSAHMIWGEGRGSHPF
jgi:hypothetical protein